MRLRIHGLAHRLKTPVPPSSLFPLLPVSFKFAVIPSGDTHVSSDGVCFFLEGLGHGFQGLAMIAPGQTLGDVRQLPGLPLADVACSLEPSN